jgi:hypothetical protein
VHHGQHHHHRLRPDPKEDGVWVLAHQRAMDQLGEALSLALPDTGQVLRPTRALVRSADTPPVALSWDLPPGPPLDERETVTGPWDYPPGPMASSRPRMDHGPVASPSTVAGAKVHVDCWSSSSAGRREATPAISASAFGRIETTR